MILTSSVHFIPSQSNPILKVIQLRLHSDLSPFLRWSLAIIAGGGVAGVVQGSSVLARGISTTTTGGTGNPVVSTGEFLASIFGTIVFLVLPVLAIVLVALIIFFILRRILRRRAKA